MFEKKIGNEYGRNEAQQIRPVAVSVAIILLFLFVMRASAEGGALVDAYNGKAVTVNRAGIVRLFDVSAADRPVAVSQTFVVDELNNVALAGNKVLAAGRMGVHIIDISNPSSPSVQSSLFLDAGSTAVRAAGNFGYAATGSSVVLFDIGSGGILDRKDYATLEVRDLAISGDYIYILAAGDDGKYSISKVLIQSHLDSPVASFTGQGAAGRRSASPMSIYAGDDMVYVAPAPAEAGDAAAYLQVLRDTGSALQPNTLAPLPSRDIRPIAANLLVAGVPGTAGQRSLAVLNVLESSSVAKPAVVDGLSPEKQSLFLYMDRTYLADPNGNIQVSNGLSPNGSKIGPSVTLDTNLSSGEVADGEFIRVTAKATGSDQIENVDFYVNGTKVATDGNYPFEYRFTAPQGESSIGIQACVRDIDGNSSCSASQTLAPAKGKEVLRVLSVTPSEGSQNQRSSVSKISARFSLRLNPATLNGANAILEKIDAGASSSARIGIGSIAPESGGYSVAITPSSTLASGKYRVTLSSGIQSVNGAQLAQSFAVTFTVTSGNDTWISSASGSWNVGSNWSGGIVPQAGDNVTIPSIPGLIVTLNQGSARLDNLTVGAGSQLSISGGSLTINTAATIQGALALSGGLITGAGPITVAGQLLWNGGTISAVVNLATTATTQINPYGYIDLTSGTLNNAGTVNLKPLTVGSGLLLRSQAVINNQAGATWNVIADGYMTANDNTVAFNNAGALVKSGGTTTTGWSVPLTGSGTISVTSGTLNLNGTSTGSISGTINVGGGATVDFGQGGTLSGGKVTGAGTFTFTASATVNGTYSFAGQTKITNGTITFNGQITLADLGISGGAITGTGNVTVSGTMNWSYGAVTGTLSLNVNDLSLSPNGSIQIQLGGPSISVNTKLTLSGTLTLTFNTKYAPLVGTVIPIIQFSSGFGSLFSSINDLLLGNGDPLAVNLTPAGLAVTVEIPN